MVAEYKYDPLGRRITKSQVLSQESQVTNYTYDGDRIIAEYDETGNLLKKHVFGPGIDEILLTYDLQLMTTYFYHSDALGSVTDITDSTGGKPKKCLTKFQFMLNLDKGIIDKVDTKPKGGVRWARQEGRQYK